jgi:hypothetical protein
MLKLDCNHFERGRSIEFLKHVRTAVEAKGLCVERDRELLTKIYGTDSDGSVTSSVFYCYLMAASCVSVDKEGKRNTDADKYKKILLEVLDGEIEGQSTLARCYVRRGARAKQVPNCAGTFLTTGNLGPLHYVTTPT